jgi:hypothetical protein
MASSANEHYEQVLADLRAKRAKIDAAIEAIEDLLGVASSAPAGSLQRQGASQAIEGDTFFGLSVADAAKKYLQIVKKKQSTRDIAKALESGGLTHNSKDFYNTVYTVLTRSEFFAKLPDSTWGLAEWYKGRRVSLNPRTFVNEDESVEADSSIPEGTGTV